MKRAVVLLNMGGASTIAEVPVFLRNMFSDANILPVNSFLRWLIRTFIVYTRASHVATHYELIGGGSPLLDLSERLAHKLSSVLDEPVYLAMRYTPPYASLCVEQMQDEGIEEIVLVPMYPQYSTTTTKSSLEDFYAAALRVGFHPKIHTIERFYKNRHFGELIADSIEHTLAEQNAQSFDLIFCAHSLPQRIIDSGDPYQKEIEEHATLVETILQTRGVHFHKVHMAYQSMLGPTKWIGPYLRDVLDKIANTSGPRNVILYPLSFTIDNIETAYELDIEYRELARSLHIGDYRLVACPNDSDEFAHILSTIINDKGNLE